MPRNTSKLKSSTPLSSSFPDLPPAIPPPQPSDVIASLRKDYRWAAISQFLWTFGEGVGLLGWDIESLEKEFDSSPIALGIQEEVLAPEIITKLLYALTYDRTVNKSNFEEKLRNQYLKRDPKKNPLGGEMKNGDIGVFRGWKELNVSEKVGVIHDLCEWQLSDPMRFRALLKSEEDAVSWRIEPCGWDRNGNIYWLFDDNRLWVQHPSPVEPKAARPPKASSKSAKSSKSKRPPTSNKPSTSTSHRKKGVYEVGTDEEEEETPKKSIFDLDLITFSGRGRTRSAANPKSITTATSPLVNSSRRNTRRNIVEPLVFTSPSTRTRGKRSAPDPEPETEVEEPITSSKRTKTSSTRPSRRNREAEEVWQEIPPEWLDPNAGSLKPTRSTRRGAAAAAVVQANGKGKGQKLTQSDSVVRWSNIEGSDSELSELSDSPERLDDEVNVLAEEVPADETVAEVQLGERQPDGEELAESAVVEIPTSTPAQQEPEPVDVPLEANATEDVKVQSPTVENEGVEESPAVKAKSPANEDQPSSKAMEKQENELHAKDDSMGVDADAKATEGDQQPETEDTKADATASVEETQTKVEDEVEEEEETDEVKIEAKKARSQTWLEWEAVCVSRYDWENFPKQFAGSRHVDERAFYSYLVESICPGVIAALREKEVELAKQEAIRNRKRSSRILMKELEREEQAKHEQAQRDMEERMQRVRDQEAKASADEAARIAAENDREHRVREREERIRQREEAVMERAMEESRAKEKAERDRERRLRRREQGLLSDEESANTTPASRSGQSPAAVKHLTLKIKKPLPESSAASSSDNWELACEVCKQHGWNLDDDTPLACCEGCGRWQHIDCHDRKDDLAGNRRRDWDNVDFYCADCRRRIARERQLAAQQQQAPPRAVAAPKQKMGAPPLHGMPVNGHPGYYPRPLGGNAPPHGMVQARPPVQQPKPQERYPANGIAPQGNAPPRTVYSQPQSGAIQKAAQAGHHPVYTAGPPSRQLPSTEAPQHSAMSYPAQAQQQYPPSSQNWQQRTWPQNGQTPTISPHHAPSPRPTSASPHPQSPHSLAAQPQQRTLPPPSPSAQYASLSPAQQHAAMYRQPPQQPQVRPLPQNGLPPQQWERPPGGQYPQQPQYHQPRPPQQVPYPHHLQQQQQQHQQQQQPPTAQPQAPPRPQYGQMQQHYGPPSGPPLSSMSQLPPQSRTSPSSSANQSSPYPNALGYGQYHGVLQNGASVHQGQSVQGFRPPSVAMPLQPQNNPPRFS